MVWRPCFLKWTFRLSRVSKGHKGHFLTWAKGHDHVIARPLASHPNVIPLTWSLGICIKPTLLGGGPNVSYDIAWNIVYDPSHKNLCRLFIHDCFFGHLGLHLPMYIGLICSRTFRPMRDLRMQWSRAFNRMCEMVISRYVSLRYYV